MKKSITFFIIVHFNFILMHSFLIFTTDIKFLMCFCAICIGYGISEIRWILNIKKLERNINTKWT